MHSEGGGNLGHESTRNIEGGNAFADRIRNFSTIRPGTHGNTDATAELKHLWRKYIEIGNRADGIAGSVCPPGICHVT